MILCMDLMGKLGIDIKMSNKTIEWEGVATPLVPQRHYQVESNLMVAYALVVNTQLKEAEECQSQILDANYDKVKATEYVQELEYLNESEKTCCLTPLPSSLHFLVEAFAI